MNCPRCGAELFLQDLFTGGRHASVAACGKCGGQWMRESDLQRLSEIVSPVLVEWRQITPADQEKELHCPECDGAPAMSKLKSERDRVVVLDACERCGGVWLDGGELRAIQQESLPSLAAGLLKARAKS